MSSRYSRQVSRSARPRQAIAHTPRPVVPAASRAWAWMGLLLAGAFALKVALALTLSAHPLLQPQGDLDAGEYWRLAQRVAAGDVLLRGTPFYVSPVYIYWLAVAQTVTGARITGVL